MATIGIDYSGSGTQQDPYLVFTIAGFLYCIDQTGAIILVKNDLDAKHDPTYRESINPMTIKASVICGKYFPYDSQTQYNIGDRFTFNDPDYGNLIYECIQPCISVTPVNTDYFEPKGTAYSSLRGFKITGNYFIKAQDVPTVTFTNIFFESCMHYKVSSTDTGVTFQVGTYDNEGTATTTSLYFNDCKKSFCIMSNNYCCFVDTSDKIYKNRCSEYYKIVAAGYSSSYRYPVFGATRYSCTVEFYGVYMYGAGSDNSTTDTGILMKNATYCSFVGDAKIYNTSSYLTSSLKMCLCANCFFSVSCSASTPGNTMYLRFPSCSGICILNTSVLPSYSHAYTSSTVIGATSEQCKDRDWLVNHGFIVG